MFGTPDSVPEADRRLNLFVAVNAEIAASVRRFRQRLAQLQQATAAFGEAVTLGQVADGVMEHGCRALGAATTALYAVNDDRTVLDLVAGDSPDLESATTAWPRTPVTNGGPRG